jgi:hypothetical protein
MMGQEGQKTSWLPLNYQDNEFLPATVRFSLKEPPTTDGRPELSFYFGDSGELQYRRSSRTESSGGTVEMGKEVPLKWGMKASFVVDQVIKKGRPVATWEPVEGDNWGLGLRCRVEVGSESEIVWVGPALREPFLPYQKKKVGGKTIRLRYGNRATKLPFGIQLVRFSAPYHEGTTRFAKFESLLRFNGETDSEQTASMNNPATYPPTWYGPILGTSYRISQASHEMPHHPNVSIVSVMRDPGWFPKWFGSVLVSVGIFWMFYLTRPRKAGRQAAREPDRENGKPEHPAES